MLVQKNTQNDSINCELKEAFYVALEGALSDLHIDVKKVHLRLHLKVAFEVALEGALVSATEDALEDRSEGAPKTVLRDLYKDV